MSQVHTHLLLPPLVLPDAPPVRTDHAALKNAGRLYDQLRAKGYSDEAADRLSRVGRLNGAPIVYSQPEEGAA